MDRRLRSAVLTANRLLVTPVGLAGRHRMLPGQSGDALSQAVAGKVVLITGASSGIGASAARLLGHAGAQVVLVARGAAALAEVRDEIIAAGGAATSYPCDLTDFAALDEMVAAVLAEQGQVDVLVNNAGHSIRRRVEHSEGRFHDFERLIQLNYLAAIRLVMGVLPGMRERRSGQIVNISSWAVQVRPARFAGYVASKAALEAWSDSVQSEVRDEGVRFTTIRMPLVRTPMIAPTKAYSRLPALRPVEAAQSIADAIVCRPRRLRPVFSQLVDVTEALSPSSMDRVRRRVI